MTLADSASLSQQSCFDGYSLDEILSIIAVSGQALQKLFAKNISCLKPLFPKWVYQIITCHK
jgi:hypothetical protein